MSAYKSELLDVLASRGYIHQVSEPEALDALARSSTITAYIGFDCTAPSLHIGSLVPIMMLYWMQQTGHRPIALMGGGTTRVGDPSGKDDSRTHPHRPGDRGEPHRHPQDLLEVPDVRRRAERRRDGEQRRLAQFAQLPRLPARRRPAFLGQPDAQLRLGQAAARAPAGAVVPRIQLHDPAGLRLRRAQQALRLRAADGRLGPVGQHRQRHRPRPPHAQCASVRADHAADHDRVGRQDGQDRRRRGVARCRHAERLRLLAVLAQHRGRRRRRVFSSCSRCCRSTRSAAWRR